MPHDHDWFVLSVDELFRILLGCKCGATKVESSW